MVSDHGKGKICGVDPHVISITQAQQWQQALETVQGQLKQLENLIDQIWQDQPAVTQKSYSAISAKICRPSSSRQNKNSSRPTSAEKSQSPCSNRTRRHRLVFQYRGNDVDYNPVAISYAIVTSEKAILFIQSRKSE